MKGRSPFRGQVVPEQAIRGALALALGGDGEQARRLDHDEDRVVLVHEGEPARERRAPPPAERDHRVGSDLETPVPARAPVDGHAAGREPLLEAPARGLRVERAEPLGERHSLRSTPSGRRPSSRRVPRIPTSRARPVAASTPAEQGAGRPLPRHVEGPAQHRPGERGGERAARDPGGGPEQRVLDREHAGDEAAGGAERFQDHRLVEALLAGDGERARHHDEARPDAEGGHQPHRERDLVEDRGHPLEHLADRDRGDVGEGGHHRGLEMPLRARAGPARWR